MKAKITMTFEYNIQPRYYTEKSTPKEMLAVDVKSFNDNPALVLECDNFGFKFSGELIDE